MDAPSTRPSLARRLGWNRTSYVMMSGFILLLGVIAYVWWPLVTEYLATYNPAYPWWMQVDWLLLGIFAVMSLLLMAGADVRLDLPIVGVGLVGGLVIEAWGTQTLLWTYYTNERPPLWIIPAWPIASLAIDRLYRVLAKQAGSIPQRWIDILYWFAFGAFAVLMAVFIWPTRHLSLTWMAAGLCVFLILTPVDRRAMLLQWIAGSALGYFLEYWGTTRECWTYYTFQTPPLFSVLAHGMAAVAFWRAVRALRFVLSPVWRHTRDRIWRYWSARRSSNKSPRAWSQPSSRN